MNPPPLPPFPDGPVLEERCHFGGLRFEELRYVAGFELPVHAHPQAFLDFCLEGTIQESARRRTSVRGASTLTFLPIGMPHATRQLEGGRSFQIVMDAPWLERVREVAPLVETHTNYPDGLPVWIAARLYREFQRRDNVTPLVLEGVLLELLAQMARQEQGRAAKACPRQLRQATEFLHVHFMESLSVETLATTVGVHPSHLMRSFRQHHHCTIGEYVRRLRIEYACDLLTRPEAAPAEIAHATGFADQSHFSRTFKSHTGMTPTEFQKVYGHATLRQKRRP